MFSKTAIAAAAASLTLGLASSSHRQRPTTPHVTRTPAAAGCPGEVNPKTSAHNYQGAERQTRHADSPPRLVPLLSGNDGRQEDKSLLPILRPLRSGRSDVFPPSQELALVSTASTLPPPHRPNESMWTMRPR